MDTHMTDLERMRQDFNEWVGTNIHSITVIHEADTGMGESILLLVINRLDMQKLYHQVPYPFYEYLDDWMSRIDYWLTSNGWMWSDEENWWSRVMGVKQS